MPKRTHKDRDRDRDYDYGRAEKWREKPNFAWLISSLCWCLCFQLTLFPIYLPLTFNEFNQQHQNDIHNDDKVDTLWCSISQALKTVWWVRRVYVCVCAFAYECEQARTHALTARPHTHTVRYAQHMHAMHITPTLNWYFVLYTCTNTFVQFIVFT